MKLILAILLVLLSTIALAQVYPGLRVVGRHLVLPCSDAGLIPNLDAICDRTLGE